MSRTLTIRLKEPIGSVELLNEAARDFSRTGAEERQTEVLELQKKGLAQAFQALQDAVGKLNELEANIVKGQKEQIVKLAVEIARKILGEKIHKGDYQIEAIVQEALENTPVREDVVVHLNPEDLVQCQKVQQDDPNSSLSGIKLVSDPSIGRAECQLETPKGIIESFIDEHIERIAEALKKVE